MVPKDWFQQNPGLKRCMDLTEFLVTCQQTDWVIRILSHSTMSYWCLVGNGWEWGNGIIIDSYCGSFLHSLLSTSKMFTHVQVHTSFRSIYTLLLPSARTHMDGSSTTPPWWQTPGSDFTLFSQMRRRRRPLWVAIAYFCCCKSGKTSTKSLTKHIKRDQNSRNLISNGKKT